VVPASMSAEEVLSMDPDGIFLSNGPGDPEGVSYAIGAVKRLLGIKPIFGICLGHQILGLALGGRTYKLKFGHHGANHPVKRMDDGRVEITAQNHNFAVDADSLARATPYGPIEMTHVSLNDGSAEGMRCRDIPAFSIQYHPEASPGPHDAGGYFDMFGDLMRQS
jgi:carbamoyl-phosphate synthase small subunit